MTKYSLAWNFLTHAVIATERVRRYYDVVFYFPLWNKSRETLVPRELKINYSGPVLRGIGLFLDRCSKEPIWMQINGFNGLSVASSYFRVMWYISYSCHFAPFSWCPGCGSQSGKTTLVMHKIGCKHRQEDISSCPEYRIWEVISTGGLMIPMLKYFSINVNFFCCAHFFLYLLL